jgi:hypothetical protein
VHSPLTKVLAPFEDAYCPSKITSYLFHFEIIAFSEIFISV